MARAFSVRPWVRKPDRSREPVGCPEKRARQASCPSSPSREGSALKEILCVPFLLRILSSRSAVREQDFPFVDATPAVGVLRA